MYLIQEQNLSLITILSCIIQNPHFLLTRISNNIKATYGYQLRELSKTRIVTRWINEHIQGITHTTNGTRLSYDVLATRIRSLFM